MGADYVTERHRVYEHESYLWVVPINDPGGGFVLTEELAREFQAIVDIWKN